MSTLRTVRILRTLALSIFAAALAHAGTVDVSVDVTPDGSLFQYDYTIADGTGELAVLDIAVTPGIAITGLTAPGGDSAASPFNTAYDSVLGLVSFIENQGIFTATPESGFIFDSSVAPNASTFNATLFDGTTQGGSVQGPIVPAVPEPSSAIPCALASAALLFWRKRWLASRSH